MNLVRQEQLGFAGMERRRPGGTRRGSGRSSKVPHRTRPMLASRHPLHVTVRVEKGLESLRRRRTHRVVRGALISGCDRFGMRLIHFSVMSNHLHLVCEAIDEVALTRGMKGLGVRIARRLNKFWGRMGRVVAHRYHARALRTPREVRNALNYLLNNAHRHGVHFAGPDPCSSGSWFDGWDPAPAGGHRADWSPLPRARCWLLTIGWRRHGPIPLFVGSPIRR